MADRERYFISNAGGVDISPIGIEFPVGSMLEIVAIGPNGTLEVYPVLREDVIGDIPEGGFVIASLAEAKAGTDNTKGMTPLRTANAIQAQVVSKTVALNASDATKAVTFGRTFTTPVVECWVIPPNASAVIVSAYPVGDTVSTTGFTAKFDAPIPASGYLLGFRVTEATT